MVEVSSGREHAIFRLNLVVLDAKRHLKDTDFCQVSLEAVNDFIWLFFMVLPTTLAPANSPTHGAHIDRLVRRLQYQLARSW